MVSTTSVAQAFDEGANVLDDIPKLVEKIDLVGMESGIESDAQNAEESAAEAPEAPARKLYFVRVPRPPVDNSSDKLKKLTEDFQGHVAKIKIINAKVQVKRDETRALRKQMQDARALKGESQPEFEEKLTRLKQLQELRKGYQNKMTEIKNALKGLDCKSEEELDAKINEMENRISHSQIELKEEKALVRQIATLRTQREQIKAYDTQKSSLTEMENESSKIKAVIAEMDGEFSILKGERDSAQKIIKDIYDKLVEVEAGMKVVEEAQAEAVAKKNDALEKLDKARDAANSGMKPYRENRAFSLQVRDMVAAGQVEEAFALCEAQTDNMMSILASDKAYRVTYEKLWSEQRRTPVAEILPGSCATASTSKSKGPEGPRPVAQGAEKAKLLIADLLMQASKEVAVRKEEAARTRAMEPVHYAEDDDADDEAEKFMTPGELLTLQAKKAEKAAAYKTRELSSFITNPAARAAEVFSSKVELPTVADSTPFVVPVTAAAAAEEELTEEQVREEQRLKAKEAEERKLKKAQAAEEKKAKAAERAKQLEADAKVAAAAAKVAAEKKVADDKAAIAAKAAAKAARKETGPEPTVVKNTYAKTTTVASAKRPASKGMGKQIKKYVEQNQANVIIAAALMIMVPIILMAFFM